jgi:SAM-dependent methyltransferase
MSHDADRSPASLGAASPGRGDADATHPADAETGAVAERYARRGDAGSRYDFVRADVWQSVQERQRALMRFFEREGLRDLASLRAVEVGCGGGGNLLELLRMGFRPEHLVGIELLEERHAAARHVLPPALVLYRADAAALDIGASTQDLVFVSTVFSSLLDGAFQARLAAAMWRWLKPGGAVVWYDFTVDNPKNRDVRGVPRRRIAALFPEARIEARRVTLAPPIARALVRVHPGLYRIAGVVPALRTHLLAWIVKPASTPGPARPPP